MEDSSDPIQDSGTPGIPKSITKRHPAANNLQAPKKICVTDGTQDKSVIIPDSLPLEQQQLSSTQEKHDEQLAKIVGKLKFLPRARPPTPPPIVSPIPGTSWQSPSPPRVRSTHLLYVHLSP
jgi:hypothetical protein